MNTEKFIELAKQKVAAYANGLLLDERGTVEEIKPETVYVTWLSKTIQNYKALLGIPLDGDGHYYEVTYNGDLKEMYLDVYDLQDQDTYEFHDRRKEPDANSDTTYEYKYKPNSAIKENIKYMTDENSTNGLHLYYVTTPLESICHVCIAHNKIEAVDLVKYKLALTGISADVYRDLQARPLTNDLFERPQVISTGI